jgi:hypothetical protein
MVKTGNLQIILIIPLLFSGIIHHYGQCFKGNTVFQAGESITYEISYNWGPIWVDAGLVTFSTEREQYLGREVYHFTSTGKTYSSYDLFFKVRDYYDSWVDTSDFSSVGFKRYIYEGGYTLLNTLAFDRENQKIYSNTKTNNNPQRLDTLPIHPCSFDMLSAVFYTRTLDLGAFKQNERIPVKVVIDDTYYDIYIKSMGRENVKSTDGKKYRCIKFAAKMVQGTIFRGEEDVLVWVTDDENKIPVYIEAKIIVGTIKAYLKESRGLRNPMGSLIR